MSGDWKVLAIAGTAFIYLGNVLLNRAIHELDRSIAEKRLDADVWTDAARNPTVLHRVHRPRRRDEADDEATTEGTSEADKE